jgi:hypothetical protein
MILTKLLLLLLAAWRSAATATDNDRRSNKDYSAETAACRPRRGQTYLTMGQDLLSVADYLLVQYNASLHEESMSSSSSSLQRTSSKSRPNDHALYHPAAFMAYTDIQKLVGLDKPVDYGSGIEYADGLLSLTQSIMSTMPKTTMHSRPHLSTNKKPAAAAAAALQLGLWLNGTAGCHDIVNGRLDAQVSRLFHYLLHQCTAAKVFVRVGYEFDNPTFGYYYNTDQALLYARTFRYIVHACRQQHHATCRDRIAFVWHSWGATAEMTRSLLDEYYPGDDYVDWIAVSIFSQVYPSHSTATVPDSIPRLGSRSTVETILDYAVRHGKPIMIAESSPFGGFDALSDPWNDWFVPVLEYIEHYDVGMWSYIHCHWDAQRMWHGVGFGDSRLSSNATVLRLWRQHVLRNPRFAAASLDCASSTIATKQHKHTVQDTLLPRDDAVASKNRVWSPAVLDAELVPPFSHNDPCTPCDTNTSTTADDQRQFQKVLWTVAVLVGLLMVVLALCGGLCVILVNIYVAVFGLPDNVRERLVQSNKDMVHPRVAVYGTVHDAAFTPPS